MVPKLMATVPIVISVGFSTCDYIGYQKTSSFKFFLFPCILSK